MPPAHDYGEETLAFLIRQRLEPTPQNYTLAYLVLNEPRSPIAKAVNAITDDGVRIKQREADKIFDLYTEATSTDEVRAGQASVLRQQAVKLSEIATSAASATGAFTRDLSAEAEALDMNAANTIQIISRMIERSRIAEDELNAAAQQVEMLRQELEVARGEAERDQLTGLANRRAIERHLRKFAKDDRPRVIAICDVDHFKAINDRHGHGVGDRVLKLIASLLAATCAPHVVGRWGGEEFLLVIDGDDEEQGIALLNKVRADLSTREMKVRGTDKPVGMVSFSAGVAVARGHHENSIAAIQRADANLYRAKAAGRNCVMGS